MTVEGYAEGKVIGIVLCTNDMANNGNVIRACERVCDIYCLCFHRNSICI